MKEINPIFNREQFEKVLSFLSLPDELNKDYLYEVYEMADESIHILHEQNSNVLTSNVNQVELIYYCLGELIYSISGKNSEELKSFYENEDFETSMASVAADKYLTLSQFNQIEKKITNKFLPPASSLNIYLNFIQNILAGYEKNDPVSTLISDLLMKSISISRCILTNLIEGYSTEAFSSWRTLHECECTLIILEKYGDSAIQKYLRHMRFGMAFNNQIKDKEEQDRVFYSMKDEMRELGLKSKDIKKYIEYGWLYAIPGVPESQEFKLNFRDGLEKVAGLEECCSRYELSSEIIHSTPLLIYSNQNYFYYVTLLSLYESFFRLEKIFISLFSKRVSKENMERYKMMRQVYFSQLIAIHKRESRNFEIFKKKAF